MTPAERIATFHRGELSREEHFAWASRFPHEVPRINGEFQFIGATLADNGVTCPVCGDEEVMLNHAGQLTKHPDQRHPYTPADGKYPPQTTRPVCPATLVTPADAVALAGHPVLEPEHAVAA
jgi:hypothetical protein